MCFYRSTQYNCKHIDVRQKVANCQEQKNFLAGKRQRYCFKRETHSIQCVKVDIDCWKCVHLDDLQNRAKSTLRQLKLVNKLEAFGKTQIDASSPSESPESSESLKSPESSEFSEFSESSEFPKCPEFPESPSISKPISSKNTFSDIEASKLEVSGTIPPKKGATDVSGES